MTRLFREGRTETVRSCTIESADFCKAVESADKSDSAQLKKLLQLACERHQNGYQDSMTGKGMCVLYSICVYILYISVSALLSCVLSRASGS